MVTNAADAGTTIYAQDLRGLSSDTKPTLMVPNGSSFLEMDTGNQYLFDEGSQQWLLDNRGSGGGGGGGGGSSSYKGHVATAASLPASGNTFGDMYYVTGEGVFYVYDSGWQAVKETAITTAQIDALWP